MLSCVYWISAGNETGIPSDILGAYLDLCETIIYRLNFSPMIPLMKSLLLVIIKDLTVCSNDHENMVLNANPYSRARETVTGFKCTTKGFL